MNNKKKILMITALFLIAAFGGSMLAYTIAGKGNEDKLDSPKSTAFNQYGASNLENMTYISNIDLIIDDSNESTDYMYRIINITPGKLSGDRPLSQYVANGLFKSKVIDAHSEEGDTMRDGAVEVFTLPLSSSLKADSPLVNADGSFVVSGFTIPSGYAKNDEENEGRDDADKLPVYTVATFLGSADLIYIESPNKNSYTGSNAMHDSIYNYLASVYTGTDHKPIIVDKLNDTTDVVNTDVTYTDLVNKIYGRYLYSPVFGWDSEQAVEDFLKAKGDSHYFAKVINEKAAGTILVLSDTDGAANAGDWITSKFISGDKGSIYYGKKKNYPDDFVITYKNIKNITNPDDLEGYEFIIIEDSAMNIKVEGSEMQAVYDKIIELANATQYIIYDLKYVDTSQTEDTSGSNKYEELLNILLTSTGTAAKYYVLPVDNGFFISDAATDDGANKIADLINASNYRGSETNGRKGKSFRVLELQPCYPIDTTVAEGKPNDKDNHRNYDYGIIGSYYNSPSDLQKLSPEEVETNVPDANTRKNFEYYAFELSKQRVAQATGLKYSQITLDQMSTEEFITDKDVVLDTYDLVYIGGNFSALPPNNLKHFLNGTYGYNNYKAQQAKVSTFFDMYAHTGTLTMMNSASGVIYGNYYTTNNSEQAWGSYDGGNPMNTFTVYNGNDITLTKYTELKNYIDAGMPIIFSDAVSNAFEAIYNKSSLEKQANFFIDPTSNMYALLDYAYYKHDPSKYAGMDGYTSTGVGMQSIAWNLDITANKVSNVDNKWGLTSYVTAFTDTSANAIKSAINNASVRPSLVIQDAPKDYVKDDLSTHYIADDNKMTIKVAGLTNNDAHTSLRVQLYVDSDNNGTFEETETRAEWSQVIESKTGTATLEYPFEQTDFYGLVSWKIVASTVGSGYAVDPCDVKSGFAYFARDNSVEKKEVRVLQVMPKVTDNWASYSNVGKVSSSLYLCPECQMAGTRAKYNLFDDNTSMINTNTYQNQETVGDIKIGLHEHKFGIVKYWSGGPQTVTADADYVGSLDAGTEDWNTNIADDISDDYDFMLDIIYLDELQDYAGVAKANVKADGTLTKMSDGNTYSVTNLMGVTSTRNRVDEDGNVIAASGDMTWVEYYQDKADAYYELYENTKKQIEESTAKANLDSALKTLKNQVGDSIAYADSTRGDRRITFNGADAVQYWIDHQQYYSYFQYCVNWSSVYHNTDGLLADFNAYKANYASWVKMHDKLVKYYNNYRKFSCYASTGDASDSNWMMKNYDLVVLGFSDRFNGMDLNTDECDQIRNYISNGGSILLTHDTLSRYAKPSEGVAQENGDGNYDVGAVNMTNQLRDVFGLNRFHATVDTAKSSAGNSGKLQYGVVYIRDNGSMNSGKCSRSYGPLTISNKDVTVKLVKDVSGLSGTDCNFADYINGTSYPIASYEYSTTERTDGKVKISVELYETQADLDNNNLSSTWVTGTDAARYYPGQNLVLTATLDAIQDTKTTTEIGSYAGGQNKFEITVDAPSATVSGGLAFPFFKFKDDTESGRQRYFVSPWAQQQKSDETMPERLLWQKSFNNVDSVNNYFDSARLALTGNTDYATVYRTMNNGNADPYKYASYDFIEMCNPTMYVNYGKWNIAGTDRAQQVNKGAVTVFPFTLGEDMVIAPTHAQNLATDIDDTNMTVWYTLAACGEKTYQSKTTKYSAKANSSQFAASPKDGMDSYFMYSFRYGKGTVNYSGVGHCVVTGAGLNNNMERQLYINIAINAVRGSISKPKIIPKTKTGETVTEDTKGDLTMDASGNYIYKVDKETAVPEFNFDVRYSSLTNLKEVYVFYDLNYGQKKLIPKLKSDGTVEKDTNGNTVYVVAKDDDGDDVINYSDQYESGFDVLVKHYENPFGDDMEVDGIVDSLKALFSAALRSGKHVDGDGNDLLRLKSEYFQAYGGDYTYLVIWAKDERGKFAATRIKITKTKSLFDLTKNEFDYPIHYIINSSNLIDITDRSRFNF